MTDNDFLALPAADAKNHVLGQSRAENARLSTLYKERHSIDIGDRVVPASGETSSERGTVATGGWWLVTFGVVGALVAMLFPVGVDAPGIYGIPDQVANIDRIAIRHMILAASLAAFVSGFVLIAAGALQREMRAAR